MRVLFFGSKGKKVNQLLPKLKKDRISVSHYDIKDGFDVLNASSLRSKMQNAKVIIYNIAVNDSWANMYCANILGLELVLHYAEKYGAEKFIYIYGLKGQDKSILKTAEHLIKDSKLPATFVWKIGDTFDVVDYSKLLNDIKGDFENKVRREYNQNGG